MNVMRCNECGDTHPPESFLDREGTRFDACYSCRQTHVPRCADCFHQEQFCTCTADAIGHLWTDELAGGLEQAWNEVWSQRAPFWPAYRSQ